MCECWECQDLPAKPWDALHTLVTKANPRSETLELPELHPSLHPGVGISSPEPLDKALAQESAEPRG